MTHAGDGDRASGIVDLVQNPPVADPHAPSRRLIVAQQPAPRWAGITTKLVQHSNDSIRNIRSKAPNVALRTRRDNDLHHRLRSVRRRASNSSSGSGLPFTFFPSSR